MSKVITLALSKGGVAKSTIAQYLIEKYRSKGYKVLGIDLDQQANLTSVMRKDDTPYFIYHALEKGIPIEKVISDDFIASDRTTTLLADIDINTFKEVISPVLKQYDYVIIDTSAKLDKLTLSAFSVSDSIIIPTTSDSFATSGINAVIRFYKGAKELNPKLKIEGVLFVRYNSRLSIAQMLKEETINNLKPNHIKVFKTNIRESVAIREAQLLREPLLTYAKGSNALKDLNNFFKELNEEDK
jgi:chromosome partitioning protein